MTKVPYEVLALEVDKLYQKQFPSSSDPDFALKEIEEHCEYIATFIESCGWNLEEYIQEYIHRGLKEFLPPDTKEQN
jgi:hypothetical protein